MSAAPGAVAFDYATWILRFPEFVGVSEALGLLYWNEAGLYLNNTANSPVTDNAVGGTRAMILGLITAHIAKINAEVNGAVNSGMVGRLSSASQGSVSVSFDGSGIPGGAGWFAQTSYGYTAWQALAPYRMARYIPGVQPVFDSRGPRGRY